MNFDEKLKKYINETPVPENLLPENIITMLENEKVSERELTTSHIKIESTSEKTSKITSMPRKRTWVRATAMIAACAVIAVGVFTHFYEDGSLLGDKKALLSSSTALAVNSAADYQTLFEAIGGYYSNTNTNFYYRDGMVQEDAVVESSTNTNVGAVADRPSTDDMDVDAGGKGPEAGNKDKEHSKTNEQVEGVAEADIIKTDGEYIYYISQGRLIIVSTENGDMELVSNTTREKITPVEMFLVENRLVVISNEYSNIMIPYYEYKTTDDVIIDEPTDATEPAPVQGETTPGYNPDETTTDSDVAISRSDSSVGGDSDASAVADTATVAQDIMYDYYYYNYNSMYVEIYDISDKSNPAPVSTYKQNGSYISSRMIGEKLYLISSYDNFAKPGDVSDLDSYVPFYYENDEKMYIQPVDICLPGRIVTNTYTIVSGLDITKTDPLVSTKALLGYTGTVYSSLNNVYITSNDYRNEGQYTNITRFAVNGGNVEFSASGSVNGYIINQFAMDEYNGNFRIATTDSRWQETQTDKGTISARNSLSSGVYVLDSSLTLLGKVEGLAEGETIQSVRFDKDLAYLVTFFQTDPLFAIDLSNPANPTVLDELKVTGFSSYLHKWSDELMLGFGNEADPETGFTTGLKLSMFDIANSSDLSEISKIYFNNDTSKTYEYSPAQYSHKAILVAPEKNLIGIPVQYYDGFTNVNQYFAFGYNENGGLFLRGIIEYSDVDYQFNFERGLYIDDVLYAVSQGRLVSARIDDLAVIEQLDISTQGNYYYDYDYDKPY